MSKIKVKNPIVEMDGDEMTRIIWQKIREQLILPYLDIDLKYFDLGVEHRDATNDQVTIDSANATRAVRRRGEVRHDHARRGAREGVRASSRCGGARTARSATSSTARSSASRSSAGTCRASCRTGTSRWWSRATGSATSTGRTEIKFDGAGTIKLSFTPEGGGAPIEKEVFKAPGAGVAMAMFNLDASISGFARACFNYALDRNYPVYLSTKNTILKVYDGRFKNLFEEIFRSEFKPKFDAAGLTYEHRLIDDMVAANLKWTGGYLWACKNYDGDVQSDTVAQGYGSLGLMTSVLMSPDGKTVEAEAAHGTVTRHYRLHQQGKPTSTNPIASIYAWTRGLQYRGKMDGTPGRREVRRDAGEGVRRRGRVGQDDQGPGDPHPRRSSVPDDRRVHGRDRRGAEAQDELGSPPGEPGTGPRGALFFRRTAPIWRQVRRDGTQGLRKRKAPRAAGLCKSCVAGVRSARLLDVRGLLALSGPG